MKFRRKPEVVDAVQFADEKNLPDGVQPWEVHGWNGVGYCFKSDSGRLISIELGDWIVTYEDGKKKVWLKEEFEYAFEEIA